MGRTQDITKHCLKGTTDPRVACYSMTGLGSDKKENKGEDGGRDINMSGLPMDEGHGLCVGEVLLQAMQVVVL